MPTLVDIHLAHPYSVETDFCSRLLILMVVQAVLSLGCTPPMFALRTLGHKTVWLLSSTFDKANTFVSTVE